MTAPTLAALREALGRATPGPWREGVVCDCIVAADTNIDDSTQAYYGGDLIAESMRVTDREAIVLLRNHADALLTGMDALAKAAERMEDIAGTLRQLHHTMEADIVAEWVGEARAVLAQLGEGRG